MKEMTGLHHRWNRESNIIQINSQLMSKQKVKGRFERVNAKQAKMAEQTPSPDNQCFEIRKPLLLQSHNASLRHLMKRDEVNNPMNVAVEYGEMLPKEGVKSLPDQKVIIYIRSLEDWS